MYRVSPAVPNRFPRYRRARMRLKSFTALCALGSLVAPCLGADAVSLPVLRPGLWEYHRTTRDSNGDKPQLATLRKCGDPTQDIRQRMDDLRAKGCRFSPLVKSGNQSAAEGVPRSARGATRGNQYQTSWLCPTNSGVVAIREIVTVDGPTKYLTSSEIHHAERVVRATTEANRVGDCPTR